MILQALYEYYQRKASLPDSKIAPEGWQWKEIPFIIVLDESGKFISIEDTREGEDKKRRAKEFLVPAEVNRPGLSVKANLLWDNIEYVFGILTSKTEENAKKNNKLEKEMERVLDKKTAFFNNLKQIFSDESSEKLVKPILIFLENDPVSKITENGALFDIWNEALNKNSNVTFRITNSTETICDTLKPYILGLSNESEPEISGICLITGEQSSIARLHQPIKNIGDKPSMKIVSYNENSFESYGKIQSYNAPVSIKAEHAYSTALNELLEKDSKNKVRIGDTTIVFWAQKKDPFELFFPNLISTSKDDPDADITAVEQLYKSVYAGSQNHEYENKFYVLGLAPNAARISIRFWHQGPIYEFETRIKQHFDDLEIVRSEKDIGKYALFWILSAMAFEGNTENLPPNLSGAIVQSIMNGTPYPVTMMHQTIRRIRATQSVTRMRASILKAYLNRYYRTHPTNEEEMKVSLDKENTNQGYRLGRLFAVLEKIQEDANPGLNATIKDRYYGAASSTPVTVYPQLLKLKNYHLAKLKIGTKIYYEQLLGEIFNGMKTEMPAHLSMEDQARFAIGYYHQRQNLFTKREKATETTEERIVETN